MEHGNKNKEKLTSFKKNVYQKYMKKYMYLIHIIHNKIKYNTF